MLHIRLRHAHTHTCKHTHTHTHTHTLTHTHSCAHTCVHNLYAHILCPIHTVYGELNILCVCSILSFHVRLHILVHIHPLSLHLFSLCAHRYFGTYTHACSQSLSLDMLISVLVHIQHAARRLLARLESLQHASMQSLLTRLESLQHAARQSLGTTRASATRFNAESLDTTRVFATRCKTVSWHD